jgi:hypothetical protein
VGLIEANELTTIENTDSETSTFVQKAVKQLEQNITPNKYND